jgi:hypothetical protein
MVLKGVPTNIRALITDADGRPVPKETAVKVTIVKDSDGSTVVNEAGAGKTDENGIATYELAAQGSLDRLTATWKAGPSTFTTYEEIVGARLCSFAQVTEEISGSEVLTDEKLRIARDIAEYLLEDESDVAFRPRYARETLDGSGVQKLRLSHPKVISLRSVSLEGEALTIGDLRLYPAGGVIWREQGWTTTTPQNVVAIYEHGFPSPPAGAARACALLARHIAVKRLSNLDDRATAYSTEEATYALITPGVRGMVTAIPEVNAFLEANQFGGIY